MTRAERAVLATSQARDLCLSLQRAFLGPRALERLRAGAAAALRPAELRVALGAAWSAGDLALIATALAGLPPDRIEGDPVLLAYRAAVASPLFVPDESGARGAGPRSEQR
jgi:hypothetical protein